jgi:hypothetical protein
MSADNDANGDERAPQRIFTPDSVPMPRRWTAPDPQPLRESELYRIGVADNRTPLENLLTRDLLAQPEVEFWIALVPGSSEARGHHKAWRSDDGTLVEPEFRSRLNHAYRLLSNGFVHYVLVSGGPVDPSAPDYVEGLRGREQLLRDWSADWPGSPFSNGDPLAARVIVDPFAMHSESNVRNADRLCALLNLDRNLIVTTSGLFKQGWWFTHDPIFGSFESICRSHLGYTLGSFMALDPGPNGDNEFGTGRNDYPDAPPAPFPSEVILHWNIARDDVLRDGRYA